MAEKKFDDTYNTVVHKLFRPRTTNRILKTLGGTQLKIEIVLHTLNKVDVALKTHRKMTTSFNSKFLQNVDTVKVSVTVIPVRQYDVPYFSYFKLFCWTSWAIWWCVMGRIWYVGRSLCTTDISVAIQYQADKVTRDGQNSHINIASQDTVAR